MVKDFESELTELDSQMENLKMLDTSDPAIASSLGALQGRKMMLLKDYGQSVIDAFEGHLKTKTAELDEIKAVREKAKLDVTAGFNAAGKALADLREAELAIRVAHKEIYDLRSEHNRAVGLPTESYVTPAVHYRGIGNPGLPPLDSWFEMFCKSFGKEAMKTDRHTPVSKERLFDGTV